MGAKRRETLASGKKQRQHGGDHAVLYERSNAPRQRPSVGGVSPMPSFSVCCSARQESIARRQDNKINVALRRCTPPASRARLVRNSAHQLVFQ